MSDAAKNHTEIPGVVLGQAGGQKYTFRFVEVGEPSQDRDEDARSVIRSHVMRDFYGKRDRERKPGTFPFLSPAVSKTAVPPQTQRFKIGPQGLQEVKRRKKKIDRVPERLHSVAGIATIQTAVILDVSAPTLAGPASAQSTAKSITQKTAFARDDDQRSAAETSHSPHVVQPGSHLAGSQFVDPFNTLPSSNSPHTQRLLYYGM